MAEGETTPGLKGADDLTGTLTASRSTILDAVMRFPEIAPRVMLKGVRIDAEKAGEAAMNAVVAGCPLGAAHMQDGACVVDPLVCVTAACAASCAPKAPSSPSRPALPTCCATRWLPSRKRAGVECGGGFCLPAHRSQKACSKARLVRFVSLRWALFVG